jgi:polysaccharide export outer membrane protein
VKNPGSYPYQPSLDALQAIAVAGGYTPRAARGEILIDRRADGHLLHLNATEATSILPGDSITVRQRIF